MDYELFKGMAHKKFMDYMSAEYYGMHAEVRQIEKVNGSLDGLTLVGDEKMSRISPQICSTS